MDGISFAGALVALVAGFACGSTSGGAGAAQACVPGDQHACACPGGTAGAQDCDADGSGYGVCNGCGNVTVDGGADGSIADGSDSASDSGTDAASLGMQSCATAGDGLTNCGTVSESCCASLAVPSGTYYRTYTNSGTVATGEDDSASVTGFRLDKYEVTVGRFRQFVAAWNNGSGYTPPAGSGKHSHLNGGNGLNAAGGGYEPGWSTSDDGNIAPTNANLTCVTNYATWSGSNSRQPINCVNWYEAEAFCIWDGGFLPSDAEWEYAAAGGSQQLEYPWGSAAPGISNEFAIYGNGSGNCFYPNAGTCTGTTNIAAVGTPSSGAGVWGQLDLAGNVDEWNLDYWDGNTTYFDPCTDCANTTTASGRVARGGDFGFGTTYLLPPNRGEGPPAARSDYVGFRCARTP